MTAPEEGNKEKSKRGRPQKDFKAMLPENWQQIILEMSKKGASEVEIRCAIMGMNGASYGQIENMWYRLKEKETEFSQALLICRQFSESWWINKGQKKLDSKFFQGYTWFANMKNRFGWRDKTEVENNLGPATIEKFKDMKVEELKALAGILAKVL